MPVSQRFNSSIRAREDATSVSMAQTAPRNVALSPTAAPANTAATHQRTTLGLAGVAIIAILLLALAQSRSAA